MSATMASHVRHLQERLAKAEAENAALRDGLRPFADVERDACAHTHDLPTERLVVVTVKHRHLARAAELVPAEPEGSG